MSLTKKPISLQDGAGMYAFGGVWGKINRINISGHNPDAAAAVDNGDGTVNITITGHSFDDGQEVVIDGTTNYDGTHTMTKVDANTIKITATYGAETFDSSETIRGQGHIPVDWDASVMLLFPELNCRINIDSTADTDIVTSGASTDGPWLRAMQVAEIKNPKGLQVGRTHDSDSYIHVQADAIAASKYLYIVEQ